jgi:D-glycero-D-manno-heptose 1,7-bisphosphate phosphatase
MHRKLPRLVAAAGGRIDRIVVCPHGPDDGCHCRKPAPGLLLRLARHYGVALAGAPAIGDSLRDLEAARAAGARPILVRTGNGRKTEGALTSELRDIDVFDDLASAARALVQT